MACSIKGAEDSLECRSLGCRSPRCTNGIKQDSSSQTEKHTKERGLRGRLLVGSHNHQESWRTTLGRQTGAARSLSSLWPQSKAYSEWDLLLGTVGQALCQCPLSDYRHGCCPWKTPPRATAHLPLECSPHMSFSIALDSMSGVGCPSPDWDQHLQLNCKRIPSTFSFPSEKLSG